MQRSVVLLLVGILLLGAWLRLERLEEVPPSLFCDEASVGYDAWSIVTYGQDQWGNTMPLAFKSFGEYKYPVHIYATALAIKLLGYTDFAVRLPSALMGIINLLLLFLLARLLLKDDWLALASVGMLSISQWHVQFSRIAWETNFALGFFLLALIAFLHGIGGRRRWIIAAFALFGIDLYTYNAAKVFVPLFMLLIIATYWKSLLKDKRVALAAAAVLLSAVLLGVARPELSGLARYRQVSLFDTAIDDSTPFRLAGVDPVGQINAIAQQYSKQLSLKFLFESGDTNPRHSIQRVGETYWFDLLLLPVGLLALLRRRRPTDLLLLGWFFLAPLPAAITNEAPHAGRAMYALGGWQMVSATGLATAWGLARRRWRTGGPVLLAAGMSAAVTASVLVYVDAYFNVYPIQYSQSWQYALKRVFTDYRDQFDGFDHVSLSDYKLDYQLPYILALHYLKYDSEKVRLSVVRDPINKLSVVQFGKFDFRDFDRENPPIGRTLVFASPRAGLDPDARRGEVRNRDGSVAFVVYEFSR